MCFFDRKWRGENPAVTRWFELVYAQEVYADVAGKPVFVEVAMPNAPPKKKGEGPPGAPPPPPAPSAQEEVPVKKEEVVET